MEKFYIIAAGLGNIGMFLMGILCITIAVNSIVSGIKKFKGKDRKCDRNCEGCIYNKDKEGQK